MLRKMVEMSIRERMEVKPMLVVIRPGTTHEELGAILGMLEERGIEAHLVSAS